MATNLTQNGINFNNVDLSSENGSPVTIGGKITRSSENAIHAGKGKPVVDAVNIDWNGAEVEENWSIT